MLLTNNILFIWFGLLFICLVINGYFSNKLMKLQHDRYFDEWKRDGKPQFIGAKDADKWGFASRKAWGKLWWGKPPQWIIRDEDATALLTWFRWSIRIYMFLFLSPILVIFLLATFAEPILRKLI